MKMSKSYFNNFFELLVWFTVYVIFIIFRPFMVHMTVIISFYSSHLHEFSTTSLTFKLINKKFKNVFKNRKAIIVSERLIYSL